MSTLPDLPTSEISYVAYWNAIDQGGVSSIDPEEVLSDGSINSYTLYDNGIQIEDYSTTNNPHLKARVKTDGWVIAWLDRTEEYQTDTTSPPSGYWDIINGWQDYNSASTFTDNILERTINSLRIQLSNSSGMSYSTGDVSLYNYEYPNATATTGMSLKSVSGENTIQGGFSFTSSTTIKAAAAVATGWHDNASFYRPRAYFEGDLIMDAQAEFTQEYGSYDLLNAGYLNNSGTEYVAELVGDDGFSSGQLATIDILVLWS